MNTNINDNIIIMLCNVLEKIEPIKTDSHGYESMFTVIIGNPPYQQPTGNRSLPVYPYYWRISESCSHNVINMITMRNWQRSMIMRDDVMGSIRDDKHMTHCDNYANMKVFKNAGLTGLTIIQADMQLKHDNTCNVRIYENNSYRFTGSVIDCSYVSLETIILRKKLHEYMIANKTHGCDELFKGQRYYPIRAGHLSTNVDKEGTADKRMIPVMFYENSMNVIKYCDYDSLRLDKSHASTVDMFKVIIKDTYTGRIEPVLLEPGIIYSDQYIGAMFNDRKNAVNFISYMRTELFQSMAGAYTYDWHVTRDSLSVMPDLSNVCNMRTGLTGYDSDWTDGDLLRLF